MKILDIISEEKKNCGCGKDPCETYGKQQESKDEYKPHMMYKGDKEQMANSYEDHLRLKKDGYVHKGKGRYVKAADADKENATQFIKTDDGKETTLYDIIDDISWKSRKNYGILHADERLRIYGREKFNHKAYKIDLG